MADDDHGEDRAGPSERPAVERSDPPMRRLGHHHLVQRGRAATPVGRAGPAVGAQDRVGRFHRRRRRGPLFAAADPAAGPAGDDGSPRRGRAADEPVRWDEARRLLNRLWAALVDWLVAWLRRRVSRVDARTAGAVRAASALQEPGPQLRPGSRGDAPSGEPGAPFPEVAEPGDNLPAMDAADATSRGRRAASPPSPVSGGVEPRPGPTPVWRVTLALPEAHAPAQDEEPVVEDEERAVKDEGAGGGAAAEPSPPDGDVGGPGHETPGGAGPAPTTAEYLAFLSQAERVLDRVDRALARLDDGSYGTCEICAGPIADEDLESDPTASRCARHLPLAEGA